MAMKAFNHGNSEAKQVKSLTKLKEAQQVSKCLRRCLAFCNCTSQSYDSSQEQYSLYPRALADEEGFTHTKRLRVTGLIN